MHEVSKRTRFRTLLKGGMSKAAINRRLGVQPSDGDPLGGG